MEELAKRITEKVNQAVINVSFTLKKIKKDELERLNRLADWGDNDNIKNDGLTFKI